MNQAMLPKGFAAGTAQDVLEQDLPGRSSPVVSGTTHRFIGRPYGHETKMGRRVGSSGLAMDGFMMESFVRRGRKSNVVDASRRVNERWHFKKIMNICSLLFLPDTMS